MAKNIVASSGTSPDTSSPDIFSLDKGWLRPLGMLHGISLRDKNAIQRKKFLDNLFRKQPYLLMTGADYDPGSNQLISLFSVAHYDEKSRFFEYKLVYWRYLPEANGSQRASSDQHIISVRGIRARSRNPDAVPEIIPDQIWFNGSLLFNGPSNGGNDDPYQAENRHLLSRMLELGKRVNEKLDNREPIHKLGEWLADGTRGENFAASAFGGAPVLRGLNDKGWDPYERALEGHFVNLVQQTGEKVVFEFLPLGPLSPLDRLKAVLGIHRNTVEPARTMGDVSEQYASDLQTGIPYLCSNMHEEVKKNRKHAFRILMEPQDPPDGQDACEPYDLMTLDFSQPNSTSFRLENASFMGHGPDKSRDFRSALNHVGFFQETSHYFADLVFPPLYDIIVRNKLDHLISEMHVPSYFTDNGGEGNWIPLHGTSLKKKVEVYGAGIGGGNMFTQRGRKDDGSIDEIGILHGVPYETGTSESNYDGAQPDIMRFREPLRRGLIIFCHSHFDHMTIENFAAQIDKHGVGWLKGQNILCKGYDADLAISHLKRLGVHHRNWPNFIIYDDPDAVDEYPDLFRAARIDTQGLDCPWYDGELVPCKGDKDIYIRERKKTAVPPSKYEPSYSVSFDVPKDADAWIKIDKSRLKLDKFSFIYRVRDADGKVRFWDQICKNGSEHSAPTDLHLITPCDGDNAYQDTYFIPSDGIGLREHGWKFAEKGQMALATMPDVSFDKLRKNARSDDELYITLADPTSGVQDGSAPTKEETMGALHKVLKAVPKDHVVGNALYSTNFEDITAFLRTCNRPDILRDVTAVGANVEIALRVINKHGMDDNLDLNEVIIAAEKLPQEAYDAALAGVRGFLNRQLADAQGKAARRGRNVTAASILATNQPYQIMSHILAEAQRQQTQGQQKPAILFDVFLNGSTQAYENIARQLGLPANTPSRMPPNDVRDSLRRAYEDRRQVFAGNRHGLLKDTKAFMLAKLAKHGRVKFTGRNLINNTLMYEGILNDQETVIRYVGRNSRAAKDLRNDYGHFALLVTGPIGTPEEDMATLSRYARGDSLLDYDPKTRSTSLKIDPNRTTWMISQPPPTEKTALAQERLIKELVKNRDVPILTAGLGGMRIVNPGVHCAHYQSAFRNGDWNVTHIGAKQDLFVHGCRIHRHGHPFYKNLLKFLGDKRLKSKLTEAIHIPSWQAFAKFQEACARTGRATSIKDPDTNLAYNYEEGPDRKPRMKVVDVLREIFWLVTRHAKYGQQYRWLIDMVRVICMQRRGAERTGPLHLRSNGYVEDQVANLTFNDWPKPSDEFAATARQATLGPSIADIRPANTRPMGMSAGALLRASRNQRQGMALNA